MTPTELAVRDAETIKRQKAEIDRLRGLLAEPSEAMVEAAADAMDTGYRDDAPSRRLVRAALVAAGRAMVKS